MSRQKDHIDPLETSLIYGDSLDIVNDEARDIYCGWTLLDKINKNTLKSWDLVLHALSLQLKNPQSLKRNNFHLTLGMLTLGSLLPYQSLSLHISLKWKRKSC